MGDFEKLRFAMHGFGYIGKIHWLALQTASLIPNLDPKVAWELCIPRSRQSASVNRADDLFSRVDEALSSLDNHTIQALDIVSPNDVHLPVFEKAASLGLPVYCEKPLSADIEESRKMAKMAGETGIVNQVALVNRYHPAVEQAYFILQSGVLGEVLTFHANLLHGSYLDKLRPMSWRLRHSSSGGGAVMDLGVHVIDLVHMLLGQTMAVNAKLKTFVTARPGQGASEGDPGFETVDVDDWGSLQLTLVNGAVGSVEVSRVHFGLEKSEMRIVCRRGTLEIDLHGGDGRCHVRILDGDAHPLFPSGTVETNIPNSLPLSRFRIPTKMSGDALLRLHATGLLTFVHQVRGGQMNYPLPTFQDALAAEAVVYAAQKSSRMGQQVDV